jgi:hypothetical protein
MSRSALCFPLLFICATLSWSQSAFSRPVVQSAVRKGISAPIASLVHVFSPARQAENRGHGAGLPLVKTTDLLNFDGLAANTEPFADVPDPTGAAGATQFVESAGDEFGIYDKATGSLIAGPLSGNTFWVGLGGPCENSTRASYTIVQYDKLAARWVMARTVAQGSSANDVECVAVSTTSDATGTYYQYEFVFFPRGVLMSFTRLTVWPDAYYFWADLEVSAGDGGGWACGLDRASMLMGAPATFVCFNVDTVQLGLFIPADFDGTMPPATGTPDFFMNLNWAAQRLGLYKFHVDFSNPANSTFVLSALIPVKAFTLACEFSECVTQPPPGVNIEPYSLYPAYRFAYRNLNGVDTAVLTHTIDRGDGVSAMRWYEIQNLNATPTLAQQGTFASAGSAYLWNGSIATDKIGDIALGFNLSSSTRKPSILYTGRVPTDPAGRMEPAKTIITGTGVETVEGFWGTISDLSVDPEDDCTFWYVNEYMKTNGFGNWNTRVASFKFSGCQ